MESHDTTWTEATVDTGLLLYEETLAGNELQNVDERLTVVVVSHLVVLAVYLEDTHLHVVYAKSQIILRVSESNDGVLTCKDVYLAALSCLLLTTVDRVSHTELCDLGIALVLYCSRECCRLADCRNCAVCRNQTSVQRHLGTADTSVETKLWRLCFALCSIVLPSVAEVSPATVLVVHVRNGNDRSSTCHLITYVEALFSADLEFFCCLHVGCSTICCV